MQRRRAIQWSILLTATLLASMLAATAATAATAAKAVAIDSSAEIPSGESIATAAPIYSDPVSQHSESLMTTFTRDHLDAMGGDPRVLDYWTDERMANAIPIATQELDSDTLAEIERYVQGYVADAEPEVLTTSAPPTSTRVLPDEWR